MIIIQACRGRDLNFEGTTLATGTTSDGETASEAIIEIKYLKKKYWRKMRDITTLNRMEKEHILGATFWYVTK